MGHASHATLVYGLMDVKVPNIGIYIYICRNRNIYIYIHIYIIHVYTYIYIYVYIYIHIYIYIYIYIHYVNEKKVLIHPHMKGPWEKIRKIPHTHRACPSTWREHRKDSFHLGYAPKYVPFILENLFLAKELGHSPRQSNIACWKSHHLVWWSFH